MRPTCQQPIAVMCFTVVAVLLASCTPDPNDRPATADRSPVSAGVAAGWPAPPPDADPADDEPDRLSGRPWDEADGGGWGGIEQAATDTIIALFDDEQLTVFDLTVHPAGDDTVEVEVLHGTGRGYPQLSRYQLTYTRIPDDGGWQVEQITVAP